MMQRKQKLSAMSSYRMDYRNICMVSSLYPINNEQCPYAP